MFSAKSILTCLPLDGGYYSPKKLQNDQIIQKLSHHKWWHRCIAELLFERDLNDMESVLEKQE